VDWLRTRSGVGDVFSLPSCSRSACRASNKRGSRTREAKDECLDRVCPSAFLEWIQPWLGLGKLSTRTIGPGPGATSGSPAWSKSIHNARTARAPS